MREREYTDFSAVQRAAAVVAGIAILFGIAAYLRWDGDAVFRATSARAEQFLKGYVAIGADGDQARRAAEMLCENDDGVVSVSVAGKKYFGAGPDEWATLLAGAWSPDAVSVRPAWRQVEPLGQDYAVLSGRVTLGEGSSVGLWVRLRFVGEYPWHRADPQKWCIQYIEIPSTGSAASP